MGSFKANGGEQGPNRRRNSKKSKRRGFPKLEWLEERHLLSGGSGWHPTSTNLADAQNGPMANLGTDLVKVYSQFQSGHGDTAKLAAAFPYLEFQNDSVFVGMSSYKDFSTFQTELNNLGMRATDSSTTYGLVEGWLPISQLPTAAELPETMSGYAVVRPEVVCQGHQRGRFLDVRQRRPPADRAHRSGRDRGRAQRQLQQPGRLRG